MYTYMLVSIGLMLLMFLTFPRFKKLLLIASLLFSTLYIAWRFSAIPHGGIPQWGGIILMAAELCGLLQFWVFCFISSRESNPSAPQTQTGKLPTVDIMIPTYGEPVGILRRTICASISIDYPKDKKNIYVCDDGKRYEVKQLCEELGVHYVVRARNEHSKSGNINNALSMTSGDLIAVFDADMIPKSNFLGKTVPCFFDENVGFVQVPQSFYNPDIFQKCSRRNIPGEQDFFMRDVQQRRAGINSSIHVGTNAVFRRKTLDAIGGYPTFSITEDIALGLLIQAKGYKAVYVNETLVLGLNAENLRDCVQQRDRWCRGNLQLLKYNNPVHVKGLSFFQKVAYMDGLLYWYSGILKLIFIIAPILYFLTQIFFIDAPVQQLLIMFVPYYLSQYLLFSTSYPNTRTMFRAHVYETVFAPYLAWSCLKHLFGADRLEFKVTKKGEDATTQRFFSRKPCRTWSCSALPCWAGAWVFTGFSPGRSP